MTTEKIIEEIKGILDKTQLEKIRLALKKHLYEIKWEPFYEELVKAIGDGDHDGKVLVIAYYQKDPKIWNYVRRKTPSLSGDRLFTVGNLAGVLDIYQRDFEHGIKKDLMAEDGKYYDEAFCIWPVGSPDIDILSREELKTYYGITEKGKEDQA